MTREKLLARLGREYAAAIRAEEDAPTIAAAWRAAAKSERALRRLQAVRAGLPLPVPNTKTNRVRGAFVALATFGKAVARALAAKAALAKAQVANAARRAAKVARSSFRSALRFVSSLVSKGIIAVKKQLEELAESWTVSLSSVPTSFFWTCRIVNSHGAWFEWDARNPEAAVALAWGGGAADRRGQS